MIPLFQQLPPKTNIPNPSPVRPTDRDALLNHSFIGMLGGEILHEMMRRRDVKQMFGHPGGPILIWLSPIITYDNLGRSARLVRRRWHR